MNQIFVSLLVTAALVLAIVPAAALAETFTLTGKEMLVYSGYWYAGGGPMPQLHETSLADLRYGRTPHIFYHVLVDSNGKETILDQYKTEGNRFSVSWRNGIEGHIYYFFDLPAYELELNDSGTYTVELREIVINRPTADRFPGAGIDSTVDLWDFTIAYGTNQNCDYVAYNRCYREYLSQKNVLLSSLAQTLEITEITVAGAPESGSGPSLPFLGARPADSNTDDTPFTQSKGAGTPKKNVPDVPLAFAGLAGLALVSTAVLASGSRIRTYRTKAGRAAESARAAAYAQMEGDKRAYAVWYAEQQAKKKRAALLASMAAARKKKARALRAALANAERYHTYKQKAAAYQRIAKKYGLPAAATVATAYREGHALAAELSSFSEANALGPNMGFTWREFNDMGKPLTKRELAQLKKDPSKYWDFIATRKNMTREQAELEATLYSGAAVGSAAAAAFVGPYLVSLQGASLSGMASGAGSLQIPAFVTGTGAFATATTYAFEIATGSGGPVSNFLGGMYNQAKSGISWLGDNLGGLFGVNKGYLRKPDPNEAIEEEAIREYNQNKGRGPMDPSLEIYPKIRGDECGIEVAISPSIIKFGKGKAEYDVYSPKLKMEGPEISFDFPVGEGANVNSYEIQFSGNIETQIYNPIGTELVMKMSKKGCVLSEANTGR